MRAIIYKLLLVIVILFCAKDIKAQGHFEWATGWQGGDFVTSANEVISSDIDSEGNLYILGYAGSFATMQNGESLVPDYTPPRGKTEAVVIFKMNPQGDIVWKKAIYNEKMHGRPFGCGLKVVGDSSVIVIASITNNEWLYFLDTIIADQASHTEYGWGVTGVIDVVVTFDLDGNKKEQHWFKCQWLDEEDSVRREGTFLVGRETPFTVDSEGNIILIREYDHFQTGYSLKERVVIDGNRQFDFTISNVNNMYNNQLFKFSPHFDSLLWEKDLIYKVQTDASPSHPTTRSIAIDNDNNIYICGYFLDMGNATIYLDANNIIEATDKEWYKGFLVKYGSDGDVINASDIKFVTDNNIYKGSSLMGDIIIDNNTSSLFVLAEAVQGSVYDTTTYGYFILGEGDLNTDGRYKNALFIKYNKDNLQYISNGVVEHNIETNIGTNDALHHLISLQNNRIFAQIGYDGNIYGKDTVFLHDKYDNSLAMVCYDTNWNMINIIDYVNAKRNERDIVGDIFVIDSSAYITGTLKGKATFGDYTIVNNSGDCFATYIAKYVDTSFMSPYIYVPDTSESVSLVSYSKDKDIRLYPNPTTDRITIEFSEKIRQSYIIDILGNKKRVHLIPLGENRYSIDISDYDIGTYILHIFTDKQQYSSTIIKK